MRRRYHIHPPGLLYLVLVVLVGLAAANRPSNLLVCGCSPPCSRACSSPASSPASR